MSDTYSTDWDVTFAVDIADLNSLIEDQIAEGQFVLPDLAWSNEQGYAVSAKVRSFRFAPQSALSGTKAPVQLALSELSCTFGPDTITVPEMTLEVTMDLRRFDAPEADVIAVTAAAFDDIRILTGPSEADAAKIQMLLGQAFPASYGAFRKDLANIGNVLPTGAGPVPIRPTRVGHMYQGADPARGGTSRFLIFYQTHPVIEGNPAPPLAPSDGLLRAAGDGAALGLSDRLFTRMILLPAIAKAFFSPNRDLNDDALRMIEETFLALDDKGTTITLKGASRLLKTVEVDMSGLYALAGSAFLLPVTMVPAFLAAAGITVWEMITHHGNPKLMVPMDVYADELSVSHSGGRITLRADTRSVIRVASFEIATVSMTITSTFDLQFTDEGEVVLSPVGAAKHSDPTVKAADWLGTSSQVVQAILVVVGVIVTVATEGTAAIAIGVAIGVIATVVGTILPRILEFASQTSAGSGVPPSVSGSLSSVVLGLTFIDTSKFLPERVLVDGGLIVAGSVGHPEPGG